jgi:hypothetical protein
MGRTDIPNDESGLKLAADLKDAKPLMIKARDALTKDVADILYKLRKQTESANSIKTLLDALLNTTDNKNENSLIYYWDEADKALNNLSEMYIGILQYAYDKQNNVENPTKWNNDWTSENDYHKKYINAINLGIKKVTGFFNWLDEETRPATTGASAGS